MPTMKVCVIGGMNTDIIGTPENELLLRDSNIGRVTVRPGGVGRNIAENLARLGFEVQLITVLGGGVFSDVLRARCGHSGIRLDHAVAVPDDSSGIYLCLNDHEGDMYLALYDMRLMEALTPESIDMDAVDSSDICVLDANISRETLSFVAANARVPLFADPVSAAKCERLAGSVHRLAGIKPNLMEARMLTGADSPVDCAKALVKLGAGRAFVSMGIDGMVFADKYGAGKVDVEPVRPVSTTGAGDSATAALVAAHLMGMGAEDSAKLACRVARITLGSPGAVSDELTLDILKPYK